MATQRERVEVESTGTLFQHLINNLTVLLDKQIELAKVEVRETAVTTLRSAAVLIVGLVLGFLSIVSLLVAGILALALVLPGWGAALIAFGVLAIGAGIALLVGKGQLERVAKQPMQKTRETLKEDVEWARNRLTSSAR